MRPPTLDVNRSERAEYLGVDQEAAEETWPPNGRPTFWIMCVFFWSVITSFETSLLVFTGQIGRIGIGARPYSTAVICASVNRFRFICLHFVRADSHSC